MLEIEQKYSGVDFDDLRRRLDALGAGPPEAHDEADHYFNAPDRDFARTGEAFRMRRVGRANFFTFKGPKQPGAVKIRAELEIPLPDGDESARQHTELLRLLGYRPVAVVTKRRESRSLTRDGLDVHVCLDDVAGLGRFAEVEVVAPEEKAAHATDVLTRLAGELGLRDVEPRSYLNLLLTASAGEARRDPVVVTTVADLRREIAEARRKRLTVGLVPTMGALHEGHASLIRAARARNDFVAVSIFVNPSQFGPKEDLSRYPRPFDDDVRVCAANGVDLVYHPAPEEIYPAGYRTFVEVTDLQDVLEGASRPGHFRGVATIVTKLLLAAKPHVAVFGEKDFQQLAVIRRLARDLCFDVEIVGAPTLREPDGLALSSRNQRLDPEARRQAVVLSQALSEAERALAAGERQASRLLALVARALEKAPRAEIDYAELRDPDSLEPAPAVLEGPALLALAVRILPPAGAEGAGVRLIDNRVLRPLLPQEDPPCSEPC
jgi:pantoate--beta-alanine ligase